MNKNITGNIIEIEEKMFSITCWCWALAIFNFFIAGLIIILK